MSGDDLRALLRGDGVTHAPGVYDPVTAALAVRAGHRAVHLSGAAISALMLGRPDLDYVPATQVADRATTLVPALDGVPLLADADTGYGSPQDAVWTGHAYARAGISGLHLDDRAGPGRPGGPPGRPVIDSGRAAAKIKALATEVPELAVIARTDVYAVKGLGETIVRCGLLAEMGADAVRPEGVHDLDELAKLHAALPGVPIVVNRAEAGGNRPVPTDAELAEVGVRLILHPITALLAALRAVALTYRAIADTGSATEVDRLPLAVVTELSGPADASVPHPRRAAGPHRSAPDHGAPDLAGSDLGALGLGALGLGAPDLTSSGSGRSGYRRPGSGTPRLAAPDLAGRLDT
ncbi:hypothetical protein GCM10010172_07920 [Paractinoplanes ferrugineus]|uniref:Methylisocitrate lyase n=1 Tax=Paractinoplanes ferrugineus TaxID=113564 RepID=A0A919J6E5_9ACTN|nr:isocitrate lyase/PEP mutase family protein [Actinoplanes ferrugineus]GIE15325.1 hypothetical protein Afe05nite_71650 [Actinoplanes ferrugineus]